MRRKLWIALGVVLFVGVLAGLLLPGLQRSPSHAHPHSRCGSSLKQIWYGCQLYAGDHGDSFPPALGNLYPDYISDGKVFLCRSAGRATPITEADLPEGANDASEVFGEHNSDYEYVSGLTAAEDPPGLVLAHDKDGNHDGGRNVLFISGDVEWMKEEKFQAALAKAREYLKAKKDGTLREGTE